MDLERTEKGLFSFAIIGVEIDLRKALPDHIQLNHKNLKWTQALDYERTSFRCCACFQTGHLQNTCPLAKKNPRKRKRPVQKPKGWQVSKLYLSEEEKKEILKVNQAIHKWMRRHKREIVIYQH